MTLAKSLRSNFIGPAATSSSSSLMQPNWLTCVWRLLSRRDARFRRSLPKLPGPSDICRWLYGRLLGRTSSMDYIPVLLWWPIPREPRTLLSVGVSAVEVGRDHRTGLVH